MELSEIVKSIREQQHLSLGRLSELTGISKGTLSLWERGINPKKPGKPLTPTMENLRKLASASSYSLDELVGLLDEESTIEIPGPKVELPPGSQIAPDLTELSRIPVLGHTACGSPIPAIREYDYACVNRALKADFALVAEGKSMTGCGIMDGSLVLFQKTESVDNGTIAAVTVGDATTIKKFYQYGDTVVLKPCNPDYPEQEYTEEELDSIHVFGQIIACLTDYSC